MKNLDSLTTLVKKIEIEILTNEESALIGGSSEPISGGNNCKCNGNNCNCDTTGNNCRCGGNNCSCDVIVPDPDAPAM